MSLALPECLSLSARVRRHLSPPCFELPTRQRTSNKELGLFFFVSQNSSHLEMPPARPQWPSVTGWVQKMADSRFSLPQAAPPATRAGHSTGGKKFGNIWTRVQLPHYTENPGPTASEVKAFSSPRIYILGGWKANIASMSQIVISTKSFKRKSVGYNFI